MSRHTVLEASPRIIIMQDLGLDMLMKRASGAGTRSRSASQSEASYENGDDSGSCTSSGSSSTSFSSSSGMSSASGAGSRRSGRHMSKEEVINAKRELLYQFDRMEKKGIHMPKKFNMSSPLEDMQNEMARLKRDREVDISVKFQRKMLMTAVTGMEFLNSKFDPFDVHLDGWSDKVNEEILDYDEVFEELYDKYKGRAKMPPELRLVFMLGGSGFMFHLTNSVMKSAPEVGMVMQQNPELQKQFAAATLKTMSNNNQGSMLGGLSGFLSNMLPGGLGKFGGGPSTQPPPPPPNGGSRMRGPSNVDDILRDMRHNDRIELMSNVSESDITEIHDQLSVTSSVKRRAGGSKGSAGGARAPPRRTLNI